jgi:hypothetical protein
MTTVSGEPLAGQHPGADRTIVAARPVGPTVAAKLDLR